MSAKKETTHSFDWQLASAIGIEKALLVGNFQFWIAHNEARSSAEHFHKGEYWTHWTAKELAQKYPYLKAPSIYRWLDQLEADNWIKIDRFNEKNIDQRKWYGRGQRLIDWEQSPIYQNDNSADERSREPTHPAIIQTISQNDNWPSSENEPNYQNDNPIYQNDNPNYQNDKCIYKDTDSNTDNTSSSPTGAKQKKNKGVNSVDADLPAEEMPPNPDSAAPLSPAGGLAKKVYGDGVLQQLARQYFRAHPADFPEAMYPEFLEHWTAPVQNSEYPPDIGKELWRTQKTWLIAKRLKTWHTGYQKDHDNPTQQNGQRTSHSTSTGRSNSRPVKRVAYLSEDD